MAEIDAPHDAAAAIDVPRIRPNRNDGGRTRAPSARGELPPLAWALIAALALGAGAPLIQMLLGVTRWETASLLGGGVVTILTLFLELFPIQIRHATEVETFSVSDVVWSAGLLLIAPPVLLLSVAVGTLAAQLWQRRPAPKIVFNVGQYVVAIYAAQLVMQIFGSPGPLRPLGWLAVAIAMVIHFAVNEMLVALVIALVERTSVWAIVTESLVLNTTQCLGNTALGILAAVMWTTAPVGLLVVSVPLLLAYIAYAGWVKSRHETARSTQLYEAGQVLLRQLEVDADFRPFLRLVAKVMDAASAELVLVGEQVVHVHGPVRTDVISRPGGADGVTAVDPLAFLAHERGKSRLATPVGPAEAPVGALAVFREGILRSSDESFLRSLADQVYVKLRHSQVFQRAETKGRELEEVITGTSDGIFVVDADDRIVSWNPAMERITGITVAQALGQCAPALLRSPSAEADVWQGPGGGATSSIRTGTVTRPDGTVAWVRYSSSTLRRGDDRTSGHVIVARDVSAEVENERAKANFVAAVSHELRTPLTPIKGYLRLFSSGLVDAGAEESKELFEVMLRQVDRLERLIDDLLDVTQVEAGTLSASHEPFDVLVVANEQIEMLRHSVPGVQVRLVADDDAVAALGDADRTAQVIANLLSNAVKYSPPGSPIDVEVKVQRGLLIVSVRDHGEGIPVSEQGRVFERFYRIDDETTRATGGTGLGLYLARQLVAAMSGRMWVESVPGQGSTFLFTLPLARAA